MAVATRQRQRNASRRRQFDIVPLVGSPEKAAALVKALGGMAALCGLIVRFINARIEYTGWRVIRDVTSRDRAGSDGEDLEVIVPSLTLFLADHTGQEWSRSDMLAAMGHLAEDPEAQKAFEAAGLSVRIGENLDVARPFETVSIALKGSSSMTDEQRALFAAVDGEADAAADA